ncbi:MAG: 2-amino-4-hydroxy-6-hydroxymethyldihydropteridine diphosphokinase, partial [Gemmatimonadota bacterium]|nr:2-amino-4-hydroxy-6-hydroxymethyldihydropteridine diphosphokinase [Gemmatimonadota bacterium]
MSSQPERESRKGLPLCFDGKAGGPGSLPVAVALGSNEGDRAANLRFGAAGLLQMDAAFRFSAVFETRPMHVVDQAPFLNACAIGWTILTARQFLDRLQNIERCAGRRPGGQRYGPRSLDLDLLLYGDHVIDGPGLTVPHP